MTVEQIQARIDSIELAISAGVLIVQHENKRIQYNSLSEMFKVLAWLQAKLDAANGVTPRPKVNYIEQISKGFGVVPTDDDDWGILT